MCRSTARQFGAVAINACQAGCLLALAAGGASWSSRVAVSAEPAIATPTVAETQSQRSDPDPDDPKLAGHFSGQVTGPDGQPLAGARVFAVAMDGDHRHAASLAGAGAVRAETDAEGRFEFEAPDMTYLELDGLPARRECLLIAAAAGYAPDWIERWGRHRSIDPAQPIKGTDLAFRLAKDDVPIRGRLLDPDGRPLVARVRLTALAIPRNRDLDSHLERLKGPQGIFGSRDQGGRLSRPYLLPGLATETQTDADGRFTLAGLGRDRLATLFITAPSVVDRFLTVMTRDAPNVYRSPPQSEDAPALIEGANFTAKLAAGRTVKGRVLDRDTREPIAGMWVGPLNELRGARLTGENRWATDEDGRFTITGLYPAVATQDITAVSPPGMTYDAATVEAEGDAEVLIECQPGIPFRLQLVDEQEQPVEAVVTYGDITSDVTVPRGRKYNLGMPVGQAANRGGGIYEGFVRPGPGAVLVKMTGRSDYRPAHVDPKAFFAPRRTKWTAQERISAYGTQDSLSVHGGWANQHDYVAIVLVNPAPDAAPLELSTTVAKDKPRQVTLLDPEGNPVTGATTQGLTFFPSDAEPQLRAASFPLTQLTPYRSRRIVFTKEDRKLVGCLLARANGDTPYSVQMQPWGTLTGRILDEHGQPAATSLLSPDDEPLQTNPDPAVGIFHPLEAGADGRFRIEQLVPGLHYRAKMYRGFGKYVGVAFEDLAVGPGEVRDLGDIRSQPPVDVRGK